MKRLTIFMIWFARVVSIFFILAFIALIYEGYVDGIFTTFILVFLPLHYFAWRNKQKW